MQLLLGQLAEDAAPSRPILSAVALAITILLMSAVLWGTRKERLTPPQQTAAQQSRIQPC
jgi:flagellar biosynthesis protein FliP